MWAALGEFFGAILKAVFPSVLEEYRKPTEVKTTGFDDDIEDSIDSGIDTEYDFLSNKHMQDDDE